MNCEEVHAMAFLKLSDEDRRILCSWIDQQERPKTIDPARWYQFLQRTATSISADELSAIIESSNAEIIDLIIRKSVDD